MKGYCKWLIPISVLALSFSQKAAAQQKEQMVRIAKIKVDPSQLESIIASAKKLGM